MPYATRKLKGGKVKVVNAKTGKVHAKATTPAKAAAQERLLHAVDAGYVPTGNPHEKMKKRVMGK